MAILLFIYCPIDQRKNNKPVIQVVKYCMDSGLIAEDDYTVYIIRDQKRTNGNPIRIRIGQENSKGEYIRIEAEYFNNEVIIIEKD